MSLETIGLITGTGLTLLVFSYVLGDNPLYRLALHLFIGALVGYSFGIAFRFVVFEVLFERLVGGEDNLHIPHGNARQPLGELVGVEASAVQPELYDP